MKNKQQQQKMGKIKINLLIRNDDRFESFQINCFFFSINENFHRLHFSFAYPSTSVVQSTCWVIYVSHGPIYASYHICNKELIYNFALDNCNISHDDYKHDNQPNDTHIHGI